MTDLRADSMTGEQWVLEERSADPPSTVEGERWLRTDLNSGDKIATLRVDVGSSIRDVPIFKTGTAVDTVSEAMRVQVNGTTGYVPIAPVSETAFPELRMQHNSEIYAFHDRVGPGSAIPDSVVAQYDAQALSGFSDGDTVPTRPDQSENGNDASGSGTYRTSDINGYPAVEYDSVDDDHRVQFASNISQRIVVFAVTKTDITTASELKGVVSAYSTRSWFAEPATGNAEYNIDAGSTGTQGGTTNTDPTLLTAIFDGVNTELRADGTTVIGPTNLGSADWDGITIGSIRFLGAEYYDGSIGFVELHNGDPSNGLNTREQEIADMWDITL